MTKNLNYMIDSLGQIEILLLKMLKFLKIPGFFKISQIPGFSRFFLPKLSNSRFPTKVTTLILVL